MFLYWCITGIPHTPDLGSVWGLVYWCITGIPHTPELRSVWGLVVLLYHWQRKPQTLDQFEGWLYWCITGSPHTPDLRSVWGLMYWCITGSPHTPDLRSVWGLVVLMHSLQAARTPQTLDQFGGPHTPYLWSVSWLVVLIYYRQLAHPRPYISLRVGCIYVIQAARTSQTLDQFEGWLYWCITGSPHTPDLRSVWRPAHPIPLISLMVGCIDILQAARTPQTLYQFEGWLYLCNTGSPHIPDLRSVWGLIVLMYHRQPAHLRP